MDFVPDAVQQETEAYNSEVDLLTLPIYTRAQLRQYNGQARPQLFVAIKGYIYDVTRNELSYGAGKIYHQLVGKDVSRLLGLNRLQLKPEPGAEPGAAHSNEWDFSDLTEKQRRTLDKWVLFFRKRYRIVGVVVDYQPRTHAVEPDACIN
ncbi:cytochrome b5 [Metschnikowia bicuspidata var. bicuspidata NRRL YB-4993]|uniref:Cytochrome b5 n=1 Tax=Metschnikowia bicuspidata var. bicuspidata NRRL YB-4993 TaxID=869754 RepID=A0A1A0GZ21_9ASCO|nr:cytochrome b5 [Metschnikowia bicuspidata var. bicuspidata NRRL YB-4993]OBA17001.1 cytochrome b5 [Metschnikowia bicuspidata var. bicuspidata NRRL YB-4993]